MRDLIDLLNVISEGVGKLSPGEFKNRPKRFETFINKIKNQGKKFTTMILRIYNDLRYANGRSVFKPSSSYGGVS